MTCPPLAITMGDPAGIGGEITLKAWLRRTDSGAENSGDDGGLPAFFMIDDARRLRALADSLNLTVPIQAITSPRDALDVFAQALPVIDQPLDRASVPGQPDAANAKAIIGSIERAVEWAKDGQALAVVTNPISKDVLYGAGFAFPGHTEFLAHLSGADIKPVMMLACERLRVVLATVHVSIRDAVNSLSTDAIVDVATITHAALKRDFAIDNPVLAVAGLNPHAGEGGAMGTEETDIIIPAIERLKAQGIEVRGPFPPDTMFTAKALPTYDAAVCMYHDQGLIPLKTLDFERGVNATLGLPFVRTSPDHGTAFDIAGTGQASELSLMAAIVMADQMARARGAS